MKNTSRNVRLSSFEVRREHRKILLRPGTICRDATIPDLCPSIPWSLEPALWGGLIYSHVVPSEAPALDPACSWELPPNASGRGGLRETRPSFTLA